MINIFMFFHSFEVCGLNYCWFTGGCVVYFGSALWQLEQLGWMAVFEGKRLPSGCLLEIRQFGRLMFFFRFCIVA